MCIFQHAYAFIRWTGDWGAYPLWPTVRRELAIARGLLPLIYAQLDRPPYQVVLAQDAAVEPTLVGKETLLRGSFCVSASVPPPQEVAAVLQSFQLTGKAHARPLALGSVQRAAPGLPFVPLHGRSKIPRTWLSERTDWVAFLAKMFLYYLNIFEAELRALEIWVHILQRLPDSWGREVLALTDNGAVAGVVARGRASKGYINRVLKRMLASVLAINLKLFSPWIDTFHQPSDMGTRPVAGKLQIGPIKWSPRTIVAQACVYDSNLQEYTESKNFIFKYYCINKIINPAIPNVKKIYRLLESGAVKFACFILASLGDDWETLLRFIITGVRVACSVGSRVMLYSHNDNPAWMFPGIINLINNFAATDISIDLCMYGHCVNYRIRAITFGFQATSLQRTCANCNNKCSFTERPHASPVLAAIRNSGGVGTSLRLPKRLWSALFSEDE